jgi:hypothetical protein
MPENQDQSNRQLSFDFPAKPRGGDGNPEYSAYRRTPRWRNLRNAVRLREKGVCQICRRRKGRDCAHLTYERIFSEPLCDLLWVCRHCHVLLDTYPEGNYPHLPIAK